MAKVELLSSVDFMALVGFRKRSFFHIRLRPNLNAKGTLLRIGLIW